MVDVYSLSAVKAKVRILKDRIYKLLVANIETGSIVGSHKDTLNRVSNMHSMHREHS